MIRDRAHVDAEESLDKADVDLQLVRAEMIDLIVGGHEQHQDAEDQRGREENHDGGERLADLLALAGIGFVGEDIFQCRDRDHPQNRGGHQDGLKCVAPKQGSDQPERKQPESEDDEVPAKYDEGHGRSDPALRHRVLSALRSHSMLPSRSTAHQPPLSAVNPLAMTVVTLASAASSRSLL